MTGRALVLSGSAGMAPELEREFASHAAVTCRIGSVDAMRASLRESLWDLVVCDCNALGGERPHVHDIVHEAQPGVPLLVLPESRGNEHHEGVSGLVGETNCSGRCVNLQTDHGNCNSCGHSCGLLSCHGGSCGL